MLLYEISHTRIAVYSTIGTRTKILPVTVQIILSEYFDFFYGKLGYCIHATEQLIVASLTTQAINYDNLFELLSYLELLEPNQSHYMCTFAGLALGNLPG